MERFKMTAVVEVQASSIEEARQYLIGVLAVGDDVDAMPGSEIVSWEVHDENLLGDD